MCVNPLVKIVAHMHYSAVFAESVQLLEDEAEADFLPLDCVFVSRFLNSCLQQELMVRGWASVSHTPPPSHTHTLLLLVFSLILLTIRKTTEQHQRCTLIIFFYFLHCSLCFLLYFSSFFSSALSSTFQLYSLAPRSFSLIYLYDAASCFYSFSNLSPSSLSLFLPPFLSLSLSLAISAPAFLSLCCRPQ